MFSKSISVAALAIAASSLVSAQTFTDCNPLEKSCPADPAFGAQTAACDFTKNGASCDIFHELPGTDLTYNSKGANFIIQKESNAPTVRSNNYLFFGRVDVVVQAAEGQGIVTSAVLQSDDLDEIDWEWVGGDNAQVQTNYFSKGDTSTYDRGAYHPVAAPLTSYHKYSIEWTSTAVNWLIDDAIVRTLLAADAHGANGFPQTPMQVKLGTWVAGGKNTAKGTVEWAGGYTNFDDAPFNAYYQSISITDYMGKDAPGQNSNVKEYVYGDKTGNWDSIVVKKGDGSDDATTTTSKAKTTSTEAASKTKTSAATKSEEETTKTTESKTEETTKSESAKESKSESEKTTFSTAAATTTAASESSSGAAATTGTATSSSASETVSTVPANSASRMGGNIAMACVGLFVAHLLV
ncbi:concanavalin A-like lectin/glucanase domain-containing protein [Ilyonectria robusta]|uniref:concanavalin A-like lectin/glucanase domain-containing protein n=1 Tax=Ilyonectria robusta TaxID=1079257 RepID=UPI001E8EB273|nr:concanavalin A-like lectin/glucanase domain-containing protein [Ilyonectria robusta]KAH8722149.1 concanavalin A-like lectin/glucanase domain-containing protein [Ilyonectria robusta]